MTYNRAAIMRNAWRLRRKGLDASAALRLSWAQARAERRDGFPRIGSGRLTVPRGESKGNGGSRTGNLRIYRSQAFAPVYLTNI